MRASYRAGLAVGTLCCLASGLRAQLPHGDSVLNIDALRPPRSPAFVLLGIEPTTVERPETPRALGATILSLSGEARGFPRSFALEFAPYWLSSHPAFAFDDFYRARLGPRLLHNLSVSIAATPKSLAGDTSFTSVGVGARTLVFAGGPSDSLPALRKALQDQQSACLLLPSPQDGLCIEHLRPLALRIQQFNRERTGFLMEVATAVTGEFPNADARGAVVRRVGIWLTPGYRLPGHLELLGVARALEERPDSGPRPRLIDLGGRGLWRTAALTASFEVVHRGASGNPAVVSSTRYAGSLELRLGGDLVVSYTLGRDFTLKTGGNARLISALVVGVGLGGKPVVRTATPATPGGE